MTDINSTLPNNHIESQPQTMAEPDWDKMDKDEFADAFLAKLENQEALITCEEMDIIEKFWEEDRRTRRCSLIQLTKSYKWLRENVENNDEFAEVAAEIMECLDPKKYEEIARLLNNVQMRVMCALAGREDMQTLLDNAKAR